MSKFDSLLDKDSRNKLLILHYLEEVKGEYISTDKIVEALSISEFKVISYVSQLNIEFDSISSKAEIKKENGKAIQLENIDKQLIKKMRLSYSKTSLGCQLFEETIINGLSIEEFCDQFFISRSKAYKLKKRLDDIFSNSGIKNANGHLQGSEKSIRLLCFNYYYYFYNGIEIPYADLTYKFVKTIRNALYINYKFYDSPTKKSALEIFLSIMYMRIQQRCYMNKPKNAIINHLEEEIGQLDYVRTTLKNELHLTNLEIENELDYLSLFLIAREYIPIENVINLSYLDESVEKIALDLYLSIIQSLPFDDQASSQKLSQKKEAALDQFYLLAFQIVHFRLDSLTFNSKNELPYFKEVYPQFDHAILNCFERCDFNQIYETEEDWIAFYYDLMFLLISTIPQKFIDNRIYVCVDFSRGRNYTEFISQNILAFKNLNIIVQEKINTRTDILVSDFHANHLNCRQIIWKNPPTDNDWANLGDLFTRIKGEKSNEQKETATI